MTSFQRLVAVAAMAGSLAGVLLALVHQVTTVPLILRAEVFEEAAASTQAGTSAGSGHEHDHDATVAWQPHDGFERIGVTVLTDVATGIGFALLLVALSELCGQHLNWRRGLYWGLGGFAAVALAPALGLPPELPGTQAAALLDRQVWWVATAALTAVGLALVFLVRKPLPVLAGVALIALPHLYGVPQPVVHGSLAPEELARKFALAAVLSSLLFWIVLGLLAGFFQQRLAGAPSVQEGATVAR